MPIEYIMRIVWNCLLRSAPFIVFWTVGRSIVLRRRCAQGQPVQRRREIWLWVLVIYVILLLQITVFRFGLHWVPLEVPRTTNIEPLVTLKLLTPWAQFYNVVGNIVWFVPLGMALPQVFPKCRFLRTVLLGMVLSLSIEGLQYLFFTGISDVDDVIFNTLGAAIGWLLLLLGRSIFKMYQKKKAKKLRHS